MDKVHFLARDNVGQTMCWGTSSDSSDNVRIVTREIVSVFMTILFMDVIFFVIGCYCVVFLIKLYENKWHSVTWRMLTRHIDVKYALDV